MARYLLSKDVEEVRIFSRDEAKQDAMRHSISDSRVRFYLGDTRDPETVERAIRGSNLVFHAAALKQVPSAEFFPLEAVKTNINGSANVLRSAIENQVSGVVCLSTDKAVYPINAMGMSKALMEKTAMAFFSISAFDRPMALMG
jgi:UDP-glucose 4-epimerase